MTVIEPTHVARELDDCRLHAETDAEERESRLARFANCFDHSLDAANAEATGNEKPVDRAKHLRGTIGSGEIFARHPLNVDADVVGDAAVNERFLHALVAVSVVGVLANDGDPKPFARHEHMLPD